VTDRFDLPPCRDEALNLAYEAFQAGTEDVKDRALQWLDAALNDRGALLGEALAEIERLRTLLDEPPTDTWAQHVEECGE